MTTTPDPFAHHPGLRDKASDPLRPFMCLVPMASRPNGSPRAGQAVFLPTGPGNFSAGLECSRHTAGKFVALGIEDPEEATPLFTSAACGRAG